MRIGKTLVKGKPNKIPRKDRKGKIVLSVTLKDCETQTFLCGGNGGQNVQKTSTGVRIIHHPSGARGESREERSQLQNKKAAFKRMAESTKFRLWLNEKLMDKTPEEKVEDDMNPKNLRVEVRGKDGWEVDV